MGLSAEYWGQPPSEKPTSTESSGSDSSRETPKVSQSKVDDTIGLVAQESFGSSPVTNHEESVQQGADTTEFHAAVISREARVEYDDDQPFVHVRSSTQYVPIDSPAAFAFRSRGEVASPETNAAVRSAILSLLQDFQGPEAIRKFRASPEASLAVFDANMSQIQDPRVRLAAAFRVAEFLIDQSPQFEVAVDGESWAESFIGHFGIVPKPGETARQAYERVRDEVLAWSESYLDLTFLIFKDPEQGTRRMVVMLDESQRTTWEGIHKQEFEQRNFSWFFVFIMWLGKRDVDDVWKAVLSDQVGKRRIGSEPIQ